MKELNQYSTQLIRELIIPKLTKEINRAKRYAGLRQVYFSLIMARWFKQSRQAATSPGRQGLAKLIDSGNLDNLTSRETWSKDTYYQGYKKSFEQGEYNLSETVHTPTGQVIRRYVSGGVVADDLALQVKNRYGNVGKITVGPNSVKLNYASGGYESSSESFLKGVRLAIDEWHAAQTTGSSAMEEKKILNVKKIELGEIIKTVFKESRRVSGLEKAVWDGRLEAAGELSEVKKICDDIIQWIGINEPKIDKKALGDFSGSLMEIGIIGELKSLALILQVLPDSIDKKVEEMKLVRDENQRRKQLEDLVAGIENIIRFSEERLKKISASLAKSGSPLTKAEAIRIINNFIQVLKNEAIPNENLLKRIKLAESNEEISWLLQKLIDDNNSFMNYLDRLKNQIDEPMEMDHLSPPQFYKRMKIMLEGISSAKVLVVGPKDDPRLVNMVKILTENQPYVSKTSVSLEWADNLAKPRQIEDADIIITLSKRAMSIVKHFEFNVILSDGDRIILEKIPSSIPGQEAPGQDSSLTAVEAVKLAKEAIWGKETGPGQITFPMHSEKPPIDAVKNMFKSILRDKNHTSEPVSYLSDFKKIVEHCSEEGYGGDFASLFYSIKGILRTSQMFKTKDDLDLRGLQGVINKAFEGYLKFIQINTPEFMSISNLIVSKDLSWVIEFINRKNDVIVIKLPNKTKISKYEVLACLEFIKEVTASSAITKPVGGIDFRQMDILIQPVGSFSGLDFSPITLSNSALEAMDLDKELESITRMASSGNMLPSPQRLKEYISACIFKGKVGEKADEFVLSMLEVFQLQAEEGIESSAEEREAVVMADTRRYVLPAAS